jgi:hypothetical protein
MPLSARTGPNVSTKCLAFTRECQWASLPVLRSEPERRTSEQEGLGVEELLSSDHAAAPACSSARSSPNDYGVQACAALLSTPRLDPDPVARPSLTRDHCDDPAGQPRLTRHPRPG